MADKTNQDLNNNLENNSSSSSSNSLKPESGYLKFIHLITRHAVFATVIMLLALGTLGVSAAQLLAPEDYKPFKNNKNSSSSSIVSGNGSSSLSSSLSSSSSSNSLLAYSNPNYPDFSFKYDSSWKITQSDKQETAGFLITTGEFKDSIIISKENIKIAISLVDSKINPDDRCILLPAEGMNLSKVNDSWIRQTFLENSKTEPKPININYSLLKEIKSDTEICLQSKNLIKTTKTTADNSGKLDIGISLLTDNAKIGFPMRTPTENELQDADNIIKSIKGVYGSGTNSSSSSVSSVVSSSSNSQQLSTYTNPYFPNFKLAYDNSWKLDNSTSPSFYSGLVNRNIKLSKNSKEFNIGLVPVSVTGCSEGGEGGLNPNLISNTKLANGLYKIVTKENESKKTLAYNADGNTIGCMIGNTLKTNIKVGEVPEYKDKTINLDSTRFDKNYVYYFYFINVSQISPDDVIVGEIDQIISQSSFN